MTTIYIVILCLAFAATLLFVAAWVHDRYILRHPPSDGGTGGPGHGRWDDDAIEKLLMTFPIAAGGLLLGLVLSGADIDIFDVGAEAMLLAAGVTASERLFARRRGTSGGDVAPRSLMLAAAAGAGFIGGMAGLGG